MAGQGAMAKEERDENRIWEQILNELNQRTVDRTKRTGVKALVCSYSATAQTNGSRGDAVISFAKSEGQFEWPERSSLVIPAVAQKSRPCIAKKRTP